MKRWISLLIGLMLIPCVALAARGDAVIRTGSEVRAVCTDDEKLYLLMDGYVGVFAAGELTQAPIADGDGRKMLGGAVLPDGLHVLELAPWQDTYRAEWSLLTPGEGRFERSVQAAFEWNALLSEDEKENPYPRPVWRCVYGGDCFYMRSLYEGDEEATYRLDLTTGRLAEVPALREEGWCLCPWENGLWLTLGQDLQGTAVSRYDPKDDSLERLFLLPEEQYPETMAWCLQTKQLYLLENGTLTRCSADGSALEEVCSLPLGHYYGDAAPVFLEGGKYVALGVTDGAVLRNVRPTQEERSTYTLRVYDEAMDSTLDEAAEAFLSAHGDGEVRIDRSDSLTAGELISAMLGQSDAWDVLVIHTQSEAFAALRDKGYMAPLNDEKLSAFAQALYPALREGLSREGTLCALPLTLTGFAPVCLNPAGFDRAGIAKAEVPCDWPGFLDFLAGLPERLPEGMSAFPGFFSGVMRRSLFEAILRDYEAAGRGNYNTEELLALLKKLDALSYDAPGMQEEDGYLFLPGGSLTAMQDGSGYVPLLLSVSPQEEAVLPLSGWAAFVNPFSGHVKEAVSYLACAAQSLPRERLYDWMPGLTEPLRDPRFDQERARLEEEIAALKAQGDEESAAVRRAWLEEYDAVYGWAVSPESLARYRAQAGSIRLATYSLLAGEGEQQTLTLRKQYMDGLISPEAFLQGLQEKMRMLALESQ